MKDAIVDSRKRTGGSFAFGRGADVVEQGKGAVILCESQRPYELPSRPSVNAIANCGRRVEEEARNAIVQLNAQQVVRRKGWGSWGTLTVSTPQPPLELRARDFAPFDTRRTDDDRPCTLNDEPKRLEIVVSLAMPSVDRAEDEVGGVVANDHLHFVPHLQLGRTLSTPRARVEVLAFPNLVDWANWIRQHAYDTLRAAQVHPTSCCFLVAHRQRECGRVERRTRRARREPVQQTQRPVCDDVGKPNGFVFFTTGE